MALHEDPGTTISLYNLLHKFPEKNTSGELTREDKVIKIAGMEPGIEWAYIENDELILAGLRIMFLARWPS